MTPPPLERFGLAPRTQATLLVVYDGSKSTALSEDSDLSSPPAYVALLEKQGYTVYAVANGVEGIHQVYQLIPDLVISEISLPDINGYQLCRLLKNDPVVKKIPVILVSNLEEKLNRFWGYKAGADAFVPQKDVDTELLDQVAMLLEIYRKIEIEEKRHRTNLANKPAVKPVPSQPGPFNVQTRLNQVLDKALVESTLMMEFRNLCHLVYDKSLLNHMLFSLLETLVDYDVAAILYFDETRGPRPLTFHIPEEHLLPEASLTLLKTHFLQQLSTENTPACTARIEIETIGNTDKTHDGPLPEFKTCYFLPCVVNGKTVGAFALYAKEAVRYEEVFPIELIEKELQLLAQLRSLYSQAETLTVCDGLTGLLQYRHLMSALEQEFQRARRYELDLAFCLIEIDGLKELNNQWGHALGDDVLRKVGECAVECFRQVDILGRHTGKELAVIFPETNMEAAWIACKRFQEALAKVSLPCKDSTLPITVSIGLANLTDDITKAPQLVQKANEALQQALAKGRSGLEFTVA